MDESLLEVMQATRSTPEPSEKEAMRMRARLMNMHLFSDFICKECGEDTLLTYVNDPHFMLLKVLIGGLNKGQLAAVHDRVMEWDNCSYSDTHPITKRDGMNATYRLNHNALSSLERFVANQFPKKTRDGVND